jgi:calmodulin
VSNKQINELCMTCPNPQQVSANDLARITLSLPKASSKSTQELMEAFRVFDREENGLITENDIRVIFSTLGEPVTLEEINSILGQCAIDENGKVKYADFVKLILS